MDPWTLTCGECIRTEVKSGTEMRDTALGWWFDGFAGVAELLTQTIRRAA